MTRGVAVGGDEPGHRYPQPTQPVDVTAVGDGDRAREAIAEALADRLHMPLSDVWHLAGALLPVLGQLVADERRRVVEPFEKLAAEAERYALPAIHGIHREAVIGVSVLRAVIAEVAGRAGSGEAGR